MCGYIVMVQIMLPRHIVQLNELVFIIPNQVPGKPPPVSTYGNLIVHRDTTPDIYQMVILSPPIEKAV